MENRADQAGRRGLHINTRDRGSKRGEGGECYGNFVNGTEAPAGAAQGKLRCDHPTGDPDEIIAMRFRISLWEAETDGFAMVTEGVSRICNFSTATSFPISAVLDCQTG